MSALDTCVEWYRFMDHQTVVDAHAELRTLRAKAALADGIADGLDRSDAADAARLRWMLAGNGFVLEEEGLCGFKPTGPTEQDKARRDIDAAIAQETKL